jgi:hypothetical protein
MKYNVADSTAIATTMPPGKYGARIGGFMQSH